MAIQSLSLSLPLRPPCCVGNLATCRHVDLVPSTFHSRIVLSRLLETIPATIRKMSLIQRMIESYTEVMVMVGMKYNNNWDSRM